MNDELVFATYINQLVTPQPLNRLHKLEQLHIPKTMLSVLLNDRKMGAEVMNLVWYMKRSDLKTAKRKALKMALWTKPKNPLADVVQTGGHSVKTVRNITHRLFTQYEVGEHSLE